MSHTSAARHERALTTGGETCDWRGAHKALIDSVGGGELDRLAGGELVKRKAANELSGPGVPARFLEV